MIPRHRFSLFLLLSGLLFTKNGFSHHLPAYNLPEIEYAYTVIPDIEDFNDLSSITEQNELIITDNKRPNPLLVAFRKKRNKDKKVVAAILAFPFPFGLVGLHRIYLGCAPYVPVVYIATAGGVFGILPFVDFCVLLLDKDMTRYINNKKIFMWVN